MNAVKKKIQTKVLTLDSAATAGVHNLSMGNIYNGYNRVVGIEIHVINNSGQPYFRVGFSDNGGSIIDPVNVESYKSDTSVSPNEKHKTVDIVARNQELLVPVQIPNNNNGTNDLEFDVVLHLVNDPSLDKCD